MTQPPANRQDEAVGRLRAFLAGEIHQNAGAFYDDLSFVLDALSAGAAEREKLAGALNYIATNDVAYLVTPEPGAKGYPGHCGHVARQALRDAGRL